RPRPIVCCPHTEFPRADAATRRLAPGYHLPGRQARDGPRRGGPPQHSLPEFSVPDGPGPGGRRRSVCHRHHPASLGVPRRSQRRPPPGARRQARRLLPATLQPRHRQRPDPRDGLWRRWPALVCQYPLFLPRTLDPEASFTPRWRPPFVTELEPSDRCHLNGLGMVDGKPKYVTALGETNEMAGWRPNKAKGGILMDVDSGAILCRGLSMPRSPRWYGGRLWVYESGSGTLGVVDRNTGRYEAVAAVPGFTRGLDFVGDLAFVGLSQVRESAVFSGIPITERL